MLALGDDIGCVARWAFSSRGEALRLENGA